MVFPPSSIINAPLAQFRFDGGKFARNIPRIPRGGPQHIRLRNGLVSGSGVVRRIGVVAGDIGIDSVLTLNQLFILQSQRLTSFFWRTSTQPARVATAIRIRIFMFMAGSYIGYENGDLRDRQRCEPSVQDFDTRPSGWGRAIFLSETVPENFSDHF